MTYKSNKSDKLCKNMSFEECELTILRLAVDSATEETGKKRAKSPDIVKIIEILENFLKKKSLICYGGTAINNILPKSSQFYNKDLEIPDYDFFSPNALDDAVDLANIYFKAGYDDVEAKSGVHHGTYKVYVNFIPVADITYTPKEIFNSLKKGALRVAGILYAPPNFLRMAMYLELSRPMGDTSRWEKVMKRLALLNKAYPFKYSKCDHIDFQREMSIKNKQEEVYNTIRETFINQGVVFFGGYALQLYSQYMPRNLQKKIRKIADFDVLAEDPKITAEIVRERLHDNNIKNVSYIKRDGVGEIVPLHYEIKIGKDTVAFIYQTIACHSYNEIDIKGEPIKVATIDTMLSFYLAFLYTDRIYYNQFSDRILCMAQFLFEVQQKNRLSQKGLLKRFSIQCYGNQESIEDIRAHKSNKYEELKKDRHSKEFKEWFLNYKPSSFYGTIPDSSTKMGTPTRTKTIKSPKTMKITKTMKNITIEDNDKKRKPKRYQSKKKKFISSKKKKTYKKRDIPNFNYKDKTNEELKKLINKRV